MWCRLNQNFRGHKGKKKSCFLRFYMSDSKLNTFKTNRCRTWACFLKPETKQWLRECVSVSNDWLYYFSCRIKGWQIKDKLPARRVKIRNTKDRRTCQSKKPCFIFSQIWKLQWIRIKMKPLVLPAFWTLPYFSAPLHNAGFCHSGLWSLYSNPIASLSAALRAHRYVPVVLKLTSILSFSLWTDTRATHLLPITTFYWCPVRQVYL